MKNEKERNLSLQIDSLNVTLNRARIGCFLHKSAAPEPMSQKKRKRSLLCKYWRNITIQIIGTHYQMNLRKKILNNHMSPKLDSIGISLRLHKYIMKYTVSNSDHWNLKTRDICRRNGDLCKQQPNLAPIQSKVGA